MSDLHDERAHFRETRTVAWLWFAFLAGPLAWAIGLSLDYSLVRIACSESNMLPLHAVTVATLGLVVAGGVVAWREWGRAGRELPGEAGGVIPRSRFMALVGLAGCVLFALVILAQWAGKLFLNPCMAI